LAFYNCPSLSSIYIPSSLQRILHQYKRFLKKERKGKEKKMKKDRNFLRVVWLNAGFTVTSSELLIRNTSRLSEWEMSQSGQGWLYPWKWILFLGHTGRKAEYPISLTERLE
jgi:hypothetical protein